MPQDHEGPTRAQQIAALMERGQAAAHAGQRTRARRLYAAVLEIEPRHSVARRRRDSLDRELALGMSQAGRPTRERARLWRWLVAGLVSALVILALVLSGDARRAVIAAFSPSATPVPTATLTSTPTPTTTPRPTLTPTPTASATPTPTPEPTATPCPTPRPAAADKSESGKWIEVDLSDQRLYAHEGQTTVLAAVVSTGIRQYPTVTGRYHIYAKYRATPMSGPGYYLPGVPWAMFFYRSFAIHGTYWHSNFGRPMSHGCVNMKTNEAKWLYDWAPKGTLVVIHR